MSSWTCDGNPKNPKYFGRGEAHSPHENYSPDCEHCGLPKEAIVFKPEKPLLNLKIMGAIALVAVAGGSLFISSLFKGDRYLKTYQQAISSGDLALSIVRDHSSYAELEQAQDYLTSAITELNKIPVDAPMYIDANQKINDYDNLSLKISNKLNNFDLCGVEPKPDSCIF